MKKFDFNRIIKTVTIICIGVALTGCGKEIPERYQAFEGMSNEQIIDMYYSKAAELEKKNTEYIQLEENYKILSGDKNLMFEDYDIGDFSKRFENVGDTLEIDSKISIENIEPTVYNGTYFITDSISLRVSNNWYAKLENNKVVFNNTDGVTVNIETFNVTGSEIYTNEQLEEALVEWINNFYNGNLKINNIKSGQAKIGVQATGKMLIGDKNYVMKSGLAEIGTEFVRYLALYEETGTDNTKEEVITNLLNTLKINNNSVRVDG